MDRFAIDGGVVDQLAEGITSRRDISGSPKIAIADLEWVGQREKGEGGEYHKVHEESEEMHD